MAKLKNDPITQADLREYGGTVSDFGFELNVLKQLRDLGFQCQHGGSYEDPVTRKTRQFDIRATMNLGRNYLHLAVECKNLRTHFPLLVSCVPRTDDEAFHEVCYSVNPDKFTVAKSAETGMRAADRRSMNIRIKGLLSLYTAGHPVGKSCAQVGRQQGDNTITANDSEVFEKWSQALSSANDLTRRACTDGEELTKDLAITLVFPVVVVPNGCLWATHYDFSGACVHEPAAVARCSFFVNQSYTHRVAMAWEEYAISHIEFLTTDGLGSFVKDMVGSERSARAIFAHDEVFKAVGSGRENVTES